jgi:hypothetical protein
MGMRQTWRLPAARWLDWPQDFEKWPSSTFLRSHNGQLFVATAKLVKLNRTRIDYGGYRRTDFPQTKDEQA